MLSLRGALARRWAVAETGRAAVGATGDTAVSDGAVWDTAVGEVPVGVLLVAVNGTVRIAVQVTVGLQTLSCFLVLLGAEAVEVGLDVEVDEEREEDESVQQGPQHQLSGHSLAGEHQQLRGVEEDEDELRELEPSEVALPPEVGAHAGAQRGQQVVQVHHRVHERVQEAHERDVPAWGVVDAEPHAHEHAAVVDDVEVRDLRELAAQHEQDRVNKIQYLGQEIPVRHPRHPHWLVVERVVAGLATDAVVEEPAHDPGLNEHIQGESNLKSVVSNHHFF